MERSGDISHDDYIKGLMTIAIIEAETVVISVEAPDQPDDSEPVEEDDEEQERSDTFGSS